MKRTISEIDDLDRRILKELQRDASLTMETLAARVRSTSATVHRRYRKLVQDGIIEKTVAIVRTAASTITVVLGIVVKSQTPKDQAQFRLFLRRHDNIKMAWMTTGEFDYVLVGAFPDMASYLKFIDRDLIESVNFSNFRTFVSVDEVKFDSLRSFL